MTLVGQIDNAYYYADTRFKDGLSIRRIAIEIVVTTYRQIAPIVSTTEIGNVKSREEAERLVLERLEHKRRIMRSVQSVVGGSSE